MYEGVGNFCESVQSFAENLGHSIAEKVERTLGDKIGSAVTRQEIFDVCKPGDLFEGRHSRELYYETHFNYKVCIWCKTCQNILSVWSPLPYVLELCGHVCMYSHAKSCFWEASSLYGLDYLTTCRRQLLYSLEQRGNGR